MTHTKLHMEHKHSIAVTDMRVSRLYLKSNLAIISIERESVLR